jgi:allantoinase
MSPTLDLLLRARRAVVDSSEQACAVAVLDGRVVDVLDHDERPDAASVVDVADDEVLLPGLVDTHVHVNEPGRTEWEGFATATRAAAAGGVTTIVDMPLNSLPPTVDVAALETKRRAARGQCHVDVGFWGGAVPGNTGELRALFDAGVFGFKCFLVDSGVEEFPPLAGADLTAALTEAASMGALVLVHAEDSATIRSAPSVSSRRYDDFLASRPSSAEDTAIDRVLALAGQTGARVHVLHLSSGGALASLATAKRAGVPVTVETCPHYLTLAAEQVADGSTLFKCCPPIRDAANNELLWDALADGTIDLVVSDHSPCAPDLKGLDVGDFRAAWGGISSLQLGLAAVWTAARRRGHSLVDVATWMAERPAALVGLRHKGLIAAGCDADFAVLAPDEAFTVDPGALHHRHRLTPYAGSELTGVVRSTWLRGEPVGDVPRGRLLARLEARAAR